MKTRFPSPDLAFGLEEIESLLELWGGRGRASADVLRMARRRVEDFGARIAMLLAMKRALEHLGHACHGASRPA